MIISKFLNIKIYNQLTSINSEGNWHHIIINLSVHSKLIGRARLRGKVLLIFCIFWGCILQMLGVFSFTWKTYRLTYAAYVFKRLWARIFDLLMILVILHEFFALNKFDMIFHLWKFIFYLVSSFKFKFVLFLTLFFVLFIHRWFEYTISIILYYVYWILLKFL